jgi:hypothetical protein
MKYIVALLVVLAFGANAANLRTQNIDETLLETDTLAAGCVQVFSKCDFKGISASSCDGNIAEFDHPVASVKCAKGWGVSFTYPGGALHIFGNVNCITSPINQQSGHMKVQAVHIDDFEHGDLIKSIK